MGFGGLEFGGLGFGVLVCPDLDTRTRLTHSLSRPGACTRVSPDIKGNIVCLSRHYKQIVYPDTTMLPGVWGFRVEGSCLSRH